MATNSSAYFLEENYRNAVNAEVAKESGQLNRLREDRDRMQRQVEAYEEMRSRMETLNQTAKDIYGLNSPFRSLIGIGQGVGEYYDVVANKDAQRNSEHTIEVKSIAKSQKFASKPFAMKSEIPAGQISMSIGANEKTLNFDGGSLLEFKRAFDKEFKDDIKTTIVQKTKNMQVIIFEIIKTGVENSVNNFKDDIGILKELNLFNTRDYQYLNYVFNNNKIADLKDISFNLFIIKCLLRV